MSGDRDTNSPPPKYENFLFSASAELSNNNEALVEKIDQLESQIEQFRIEASDMEEQRDSLTKALTEVAEDGNKSTLTPGHREEIEANINRLMLRLLSVTVKVDIPRTTEQTEAYDKVKSLLNDLQNKVNSGLGDYRKILESYLSACSSEQTGPVDSSFQQVILSCTVDDQKNIRKILKNWIKVFDELHEKWLDACKSNVKLL